MNLLLLVLAFLLFPITAHAQKEHIPQIRNHCTLAGSTVLDAKTGKETEDVTVTCSITVDGEKVWEDRLDLLRPTSYREAYDAVDEFRTKGFKEILRKGKPKK